jgi:aspartate/methionine/tyrosine aminotransferase
LIARGTSQLVSVLARPGRVWPGPSAGTIKLGTGETNFISFRTTNKPVLRQQQGSVPEPDVEDGQMVRRDASAQPDIDHKIVAARARSWQASARSNIAPFMVMEVMNEAARREAAGERVIHMEVGQPATAAPRAAREAAKRAIDDGALGYTLALGNPVLRERISQHYKDWYGIDVSSSRVVITSGSSAAFVLAFLTLFDVGDQVALPSPGYPCYRQILSALGQRPSIVETGPNTRWMPTSDQIDAIADDIAGLLLASPANPTGTMLENDRLAGLVKLCDQQGLWFISDEIYHGLTYGRKAETALAHSDNAIVINSFSKYFSMTGWRIGWMVVPDALVDVVERIAQNVYICAPAVAQVAALGAFDGMDELERNVAVYRANREVLLDGLPQVGFDEIVPADGAFYLYCDVSKYTTDSLAFSQTMLKETGVAATSGIDFDVDRGGRYLRFSYAGATEDMVEALERLKAWDRLS